MFMNRGFTLLILLCPVCILAGEQTRCPYEQEIFNQLDKESRVISMREGLDVDVKDLKLISPQCLIFEISPQRWIQWRKEWGDWSSSWGMEAKDKNNNTVTQILDNSSEMVIVHPNCDRFLVPMPTLGEIHLFLFFQEEWQYFDSLKMEKGSYLQQGDFLSLYWIPWDNSFQMYFHARDSSRCFLWDPLKEGRGEPFDEIPCGDNKMKYVDVWSSNAEESISGVSMLRYGIHRESGSLFDFAGETLRDINIQNHNLVLIHPLLSQTKMFYMATTTTTTDAAAAAVNSTMDVLIAVLSTAELVILDVHHGRVIYRSCKACNDNLLHQLSLSVYHNRNDNTLHVWLGDGNARGDGFLFHQRGLVYYHRCLISPMEGTSQSQSQSQSQLQWSCSFYFTLKDKQTSDVFQSQFGKGVGLFALDKDSMTMMLGVSNRREIIAYPLSQFINPELSSSWCKDCTGELFGNLTQVDVCRVCGGNGTSCLGCDGIAWSNHTEDICGVCQGDSTSCSFVSHPERFISRLEYSSYPYFDVDFSEWNNNGEQQQQWCGDVPLWIYLEISPHYPWRRELYSRILWVDRESNDILCTGENGYCQLSRADDLLRLKWIDRDQRLEMNTSEIGYSWMDYHENHGDIPWVNCTETIFQGDLTTHYDSCGLWNGSNNTCRDCNHRRVTIITGIQNASVINSCGICESFSTLDQTCLELPPLFNPPSSSSIKIPCDQDSYRMNQTLPYFPIGSTTTTTIKRDILWRLESKTLPFNRAILDRRTGILEYHNLRKINATDCILYSARDSYGNHRNQTLCIDVVDCNAEFIGDGDISLQQQQLGANLNLQDQPLRTSMIYFCIFLIGITIVSTVALISFVLQNRNDYKRKKWSVQ